jgi:hypothetical protein
LRRNNPRTCRAAPREEKAVSHLLKRPRLAVAVGLALALLLALVTGVVATSFVRSGHAVKAVKVATDDAQASTTSGNWDDVPSMAVTMSVPANTQALFLITFSADNACSVAGFCLIRALMNGQEVAPGEFRFGTPDEATNSMQFLASPVLAGTYTIKIQYTPVFADSTLSLFSRTLSVLRSVV